MTPLRAKPGSRAIAGKLRIELGSGQSRTRRYKGNVEAYNLYLKGKYHFNKFHHTKAKEYFEQAIAVDPNYAQAWFGMALYYWILGYSGTTSPKESHTNFMSAIRKALELDETLPEAHSALAVSRAMVFDWKGAEHEIHRALELGPEVMDVWLHYGTWYLGSLRRWDEAVIALKRGLEVDPLSAVLHGWLGRAHFLMRQHEQAIKDFQATMELDTTFYRVHVFLGLAYIEMGKFVEGIQVVERAKQLYGHLSIDRGLIGYAFARANRIDETQKILIELQTQDKNKQVPAIAFALIYQGLEEQSKVFDYLEKATEEPHCLFLELYASPIFDSLQSHPRYKALLRKMNLEP